MEMVRLDCLHVSGDISPMKSLSMRKKTSNDQYLSEIEFQHSHLLVLLQILEEVGSWRTRIHCHLPRYLDRGIIICGFRLFSWAQVHLWRDVWILRRPCGTSFAALAVGVALNTALALFFA
jgi:hypothetical protein